MISKGSPYSPHTITVWPLFPSGLDLAMTFYDSDDTGTGSTVACFLTDVPRRSLAPVACLAGCGEIVPKGDPGKCVDR